MIKYSNYVSNNYKHRILSIIKWLHLSTNITSHIMKLIRIKYTLLLFILSSFTINAQIQALFNNKTQLRNMTERWELDTTSVRGTFLITPYKPIYVLPLNWSSMPNEKPHSGNVSPDYIAPPGVDYYNIENKFQLSFKTKILQSFLWDHADL